jgi:hypothetical protein
MRNARRLEHTPGLASSAFAHHYSRNHSCFLFLRVLRCFTSPRSHQPAYTFSRRRHPMTGARLPHSEIPGSTSGCRLPEAYRRLPRPSSAPDAKASTVRPQKLEHTRRSKLLKILNQKPAGSRRNPQSRLRDARVHCAVLKQQPAPQPTPHRHEEEGPETRETQTTTPRPDPKTEPQGPQGPFPQDPTACPATHPPEAHRSHSRQQPGGTSRVTRTGDRVTSAPPMSNPPGRHPLPRDGSWIPQAHRPRRSRCSLERR